MSLTEWMEELFSPETYSPRRALRYAKEQDPKQAQDFDETFLDLATEEQRKKGTLSQNDVDRITFRAKIQARHRQRSQTKKVRQLEPKKEKKDEPEPLLPKNITDRLNKQLQSIKTTTSLILEKGESGIVRNIKLKTAQENILKILDELSTQTKTNDIPLEKERAIRLETSRWSELAKKIHARLYSRISAREFKDHIDSFEQSIQKTQP